MDHLTPGLLNSFADGELSVEQAAEVHAHLAGCQECTAKALSQMVLKSTVARAGERYAMPEGLRGMLLQNHGDEAPRRRGGFGWTGWAVTAALLLASVNIGLLQRGAVSRTREAALVTEVSDLHIGTLAANQEPQVLSSDRHTVKPWFQGKIPFSFNLPEGLPDDTKLDGANLAYVRNQPVAQLLYSIGKHRVSVFVRERSSSDASAEVTTDHSGFHVISASTQGLDLVAVSDVDPARLSSLVDALVSVQTKGH